MNKYFIILGMLLLSLHQYTFAGITNEPDSAYILAYATTKNYGQSGLHFAWSTDKESWHAIGPEYSYVKCDYGRWGSEKRMFNPFLFQTSDGVWHCVWNLNDKNAAIAYVTSDNLTYWKRQSYYPDTKDFKIFSTDRLTSEKNKRQEVLVSGKPETGTVNKVPWTTINGLIKTQQLSAYTQQLWSEKTIDDPERFADLQTVNVSLTPDISKSKKISDLLVGVFFEDINYAADGGIYAELIQNRDFEYTPEDKEGRDQSWNSKKAWKITGNGTFTIDSASPIHPNNSHYAVLAIEEPGAALINEGFDGIVLKAGEKYDFSLFARNLSGKNSNMTVRLTDADGNVYAETSLKTNSSEWKKYNTVLTAKKSISNAQLEIIPQSGGNIALDMISLFPQNTFKGHKNGLRTDLAQSIADIHPRFVRFPGGCVAHGDGLENMYRWQNTVGPLESRKPQRNLWGYHQTAGLGYFEYFQFCEDIGAEPVPVVPAGVPCQNSAHHHGHSLGGQQGGIPMSEMNSYIQEILDLIEWANGDAKTKWGKIRAEAGHPKPFNLKYLGIGNEDLISDVFDERFTMIFKAVKEKHPEITVIGTVGPFFEGTDYVEGWKIATKLKVPMVDEHYYQTPGWFIYNQDFYDKYDRSKSKVYLGEYAAHLPGRPNNLETALAEAICMTALERNGDVVHMTSYAPLLAKEGYTQWNPDLIYFNNTEVKPTVGYHVQKLFGQNSGDEYIPGTIMCSDNNEKVKSRIATSIVRDTKTNDLILKAVNLLPVNVNFTCDLSSFRLSGTNAKKTILEGKPDSKDAKPQQVPCSIKDLENMNLPPYSFIVVRMKAE